MVLPYKVGEYVAASFTKPRFINLNRGFIFFHTFLNPFRVLLSLFSLNEIPHKSPFRLSFNTLQRIILPLSSKSNDRH